MTVLTGQVDGFPILLKGCVKLVQLFGCNDERVSWPIGRNLSRRLASYSCPVLQTHEEKTYNIFRQPTKNIHHSPRRLTPFVEEDAPFGVNRRRLWLVLVGAGSGRGSLLRVVRLGGAVVQEDGVPI